MKPDNLKRITPQWLTKFQARLLANDRSPATVESHCRHLKAAMNWAKEQGIIPSVPQFPRLKQARIERAKSQRESARFLLRGLWLSGLRLGESLVLTWDQWADGIRVDMAGVHVFLLIPAESEKGARDRVYPTTPDFAEFLRAVPSAQRTGFVFNPIFPRGPCRRLDTVSKLIIRLGEAA